MKYKLIKLLPFENSPKIGYTSQSHLSQKDKVHYWNGNWFNPENYPEFWEKVVEKDYEILSLIEGDKFYTVDSNFEIQSTFGGEDEVDNAWSSKEKAEEYILLNKPCLSYGDVQEYLKVKDCNKVLDLVQSKIKQSV